MNTKHTTKLKNTPTGEDLERWAKFEDAAMAEGFTKIPNTLIRNPKLSHGAFRLYSVLLSYAWQDGFCFPGQERLAEDMGIGLRMVYQYMRELEAAKLIHVRHRPLHKGVNKTNVYTFMAPLETGVKPDRQDSSDPDRQDSSDNEDAVDEDSISPLSPPRGAAEGKKRKAGSVSGPSDTSSLDAKREPAQNRAEGRVKDRSARRPNRSRAGTVQTPEAGLKALTDLQDRLGGNPYKRFVPLAKRWDFREDNPPWWVMKELDNDHQLLDRIERVVRKAVRDPDPSPPGDRVQSADSPSLPSTPETDAPTAEAARDKDAEVDAILANALAEAETEGERQFIERQIRRLQGKAKQKEAVLDTDDLIEEF